MVMLSHGCFSSTSVPHLTRKDELWATWKGKMPVPWVEGFLEGLLFGCFYFKQLGPCVA